MLQKSQEVWDQVLSIIKPRINEQSFLTWFGPLKPVEIDDNTLRVQIPSKFFSEWIDEHYYSLVKGALEKVIHSDATIEYEINKEIAGGGDNGGSLAEVESIIPETHNLTYRGHISRINPQYSFDKFVEGPSNQFARAVALAVAEKPGKTRFNPLLIWGGVGLGKTHLAQAIGLFALQHQSSVKLDYISSKQFVVEFINSVRNNKREEFSNHFDNIDLLIVDDIEFFINKTETQVEFFHIFNTLHQRGKQIVLTSDRPPREFSDAIQERLTSRFQNGLVVDIKPPDLETRVAILQKKALDSGIELDSEVALTIATHITRNIRELQGALNHIIAYSDIMKAAIDVNLAKSILKELKFYETKPVSIEGIQQVVAKHFGINENLLRDKTRKKEVVIPRQIAVYLTKELTNYSLKTIGLHFGGRDHSTVLHAVNSVNLMMNRDEQLAETVSALKQKVDYARD